MNMKRSEYNKLKQMRKTDLVKYAADVTDANTKLVESTANVLQVQDDNESLRIKIQNISAAILERFDADGVQDITLPTGRFFGLQTLWWAITNASKLLDLFREIINILKGEEETVVENNTEVETNA